MNLPRLNQHSRFLAQHREAATRRLNRARIECDLAADADPEREIEALDNLLYAIAVAEEWMAIGAGGAC